MKSEITTEMTLLQQAQISASESFTTWNAALARVFLCLFKQRRLVLFPRVWRTYTLVNLKDTFVYVKFSFKLDKMLWNFLNITKRLLERR
jgi:hypothetical protein